MADSKGAGGDPSRPVINRRRVLLRRRDGTVLSELPVLQPGVWKVYQPGRLRQHGAGAAGREYVRLLREQPSDK